MSDKVRKSLIRLINDIKMDAIVGTVKTVDVANYTCDVEPMDGGAEYHDVRLKVAIDNNDGGLVQIPKQGSQVIISPLNETQTAFFVLVFTEVTEFHVKVDGGAKIQVKANGEVLINGGLLGGLPKIVDLKAELVKLNANINTLKVATQTAVAAYSAALDGGSSATAFNAALASMQAQNLTTLENTKVKQ
jgi:virulence-associated protein VagC